MKEKKAWDDCNGGDLPVAEATRADHNMTFSKECSGVTRVGEDRPSYVLEEIKY